MFPATLFDFNGVLVDDEHVHLEAFQDTLLPLGISLSTADYWDKYLGFDDVGAFEAILLDHGRVPTVSEVRVLVEAKRPHYMKRATASLKTFPGADELVRRRRESGPIAVVSGALTDEIELGLERLAVRALVGKIISAEDTSQSKPHPEGYQMGIDWLRPELGDRAQQALVIEDSPAGIEAACAAALTVIGVAHSYPPPVLTAAGAHLVVERIADLEDSVLRELYAKRFGP